jgi:probable rRNA maturation factor
MQFPDLPAFEDVENPISFYNEDLVLDLSASPIWEAWLLRVAEREQHKIREIVFVFCSDEHLRGINVEFLDHDYYTDIITFDNGGGPAGLSGEMYISTERVADNAAQLGVAFEQELRRVMVHGLLHLIGYGDKTSEEAQQMRERENFYLSRDFS